MIRVTVLILDLTLISPSRGSTAYAAVKTFIERTERCDVVDQFLSIKKLRYQDKMTEWMRDSGNGVTSEDYLLGKEIDKNFEQQGTMGQINAVEYGN